MQRLLALIQIIFSFQLATAQDTFSIVAVDSITGEVGSAGASCVDMANFPLLETDFLGELFPGVGAINTQSYYDATNQLNARLRMLAGDTPQQIIDYLVANDVGGNPTIRQYGIAALVNGVPQAAAYTGVNCLEYKGHLTGRYYSIQGNILLGRQVLDSMEARFLRAEGDLACRLMAAMQGAKIVGADTRCTPFGTSSLFAFLKVAQPTDTIIAPSFRISVKTTSSQRFEPIDSLQKLFNAIRLCPGVTMGVDKKNDAAPTLRVYPNPVKKLVYITTGYTTSQLLQLSIYNISGQLILQHSQPVSKPIDLSQLDNGIYFMQIQVAGHTSQHRIVKSE
jgi:uncharacterized Ntn-hydrolase superfamily protein